MKLIFCGHCYDIVRLELFIKNCECGKSGGMYKNGLDAVYWGMEAMPFGFDNGSFNRARRSQPEDGIGLTFDAFIIPKKCQTFVKIKKGDLDE